MKLMISQYIYLNTRLSSTKSYVVGTQKNRHSETNALSTQTNVATDG